MTHPGRALLTLCCLLAPASLRAAVVDPPSLALRGPAARKQLLVGAAGGDLTRAARYRPLDEKVARVSPSGLVRAAGDGRTTIEVSLSGRTLTVPVTVSDFGRPRRLSFTADLA